MSLPYKLAILHLIKIQPHYPPYFRAATAAKMKTSGQMQKLAVSMKVGMDTLKASDKREWEEDKGDKTMAKKPRSAKEVKEENGMEELDVQSNRLTNNPCIKVLGGKKKSTAKKKKELPSMLLQVRLWYSLKLQLNPGWSLCWSSKLSL